MRTRARLLGCLVAMIMLGGVGAGSAQAAQVEWEQGLGLTHAARLTAQIDPEGVDTTCHAQYATQEAVEGEGWGAAATVACTPEDLGSGATGQVASAEATGLALNTVYEFRFLAGSGGSTVAGTAETFRTFGVESFSVTSVDAKGHSYAEAGGHMFELDTKIVLNTSYLHGGNASADATLKDVDVALPPGLVGDPAAMPRCPQRLEETSQCPVDSQVGTIGVRLVGDARRGRTLQEEEEFGMHPLFNLVPPKGVAARFGGYINGDVSAFIDASVRSGGDYGVDADSVEITPFGNPTRVGLVMWGDPAAAAHDPERICPKSELYGGYQRGCAYEGEGKPFLREPTSCLGPLNVGLGINSYQEPGLFALASTGLPETTGCEEVPFEPSLEVRPTTSAADSPTGLDVTLKVPQNEEPEGIDSSDLKDATVILPAGVTVNPSSADGLVGCPESGPESVGFTGFKELNPEGEPGVRTAQFTPGAAECPAGSKLGTATIHTPLLGHPLTGGLYLATPHANPFGSLVAVYLTVYDPISGVVLKLPGEVELNAKTGRITTTFVQNPQLPFEALEVSLFGTNKEAPEKSRASLTTPLTCGSYATASTLSPWSGNPPSMPVSEPFRVTEAPGGGGCVKSEGEAPNSPSMKSGTASPVAGTFSPFVLTLTREDGSQRFSGLDVTLPPGLVGKIAGVQQCPQAAIEAAQRRSNEGEGAVEQAHPSCPAGSEVGVVHVGAGSGAPFFVTGHAYFAGPYNGAPFSLVIVTPAVAGPFDLGTVVVRAALFIDPHTAQVSVKSDPFPTILDGIPLDIRTVQVEVNRPDFTLNPTSCDVMSVTGEVQSTAGQTVGLSDRFQVGGCSSMPFAPSFAVSTQGSTSRGDGASLSVAVGSSAGQANIAKVDVELPKQLPARDATLRLACTEATFAANPAGCPEGSRVGTAIASTPLLSSPLTGPVYLVSHGGAAFPDVEVVLQGEGITLVLDGKTNIANGIISSSFDTVPDAPVTSFQMTLPEGPHSLLAAPAGKLCSLTRTVTVKKRVLVKSKQHGHIEKRRVTRDVKKTVAASLVMPTSITAQNGAAIKQNTIITITSCPAVKTRSATAKHKTKAHEKGKKGRYGLSLVAAKNSRVLDY